MALYAQPKAHTYLLMRAVAAHGLSGLGGGMWAPRHPHHHHPSGGGDKITREETPCHFLLVEIGSIMERKFRRRQLHFFAGVPIIEPNED